MYTKHSPRHRWFMILWLALLWLPGGLPSSSAHAAAEDGIRTDWQLQLTTLRVVDAQEEGCSPWPFCSDGDEPYFVVIQFGVQYKTVGSTYVQWGGHLDEGWAKGVDDNAVRTIPDAMGKVSYANVNLITRDDFFCRQQMPGGIGAIVIAMEHDGTPFSEVSRIMNNLKTAIEAELRTFIEEGQLTLTDAETDVRAAVQRIIDQVSPDFWESLELLVISGGDPDDFIGYHVFLFGAADPRVKTDLQIPVVTNTTIDALDRIHFESTPGVLVFANQNTRYEVTADLSPTTPIPTTPVAGLHVQVNTPVRAPAVMPFTAVVTEGSGVIYDWDWGDGSEKSICPAASHIYSRPGRYSVTVTASTRFSTQRQQVTVEVLPPPHTGFLPLIHVDTVAQ